MYSCCWTDQDNCFFLCTWKMLDQSNLGYYNYTLWLCLFISLPRLVWVANLCVFSEKYNCVTWKNVNGRNSGWIRRGLFSWWVSSVVGLLYNSSTVCLLFSSDQIDYLSIKFWSLHLISSSFQDIHLESFSAQSWYLFSLYSHSCSYICVRVCLAVFYCCLCLYVWVFYFNFFFECYI